MNQFFDTYGSLLVPAVIALVVVIVLLKIVMAIEHAIVRIASALLTIIVLGAVLIGGASLVGRINTIQNAAMAAVSSLGGSGNTASAVSAAALTSQLDAQARKALADVGLNPSYLRLYVSCDGSQPRLHLSYLDDRFMFGALSHHDFTVPVNANVRC